MDAADRLVREPLTVEFGADQPSGFFGICIEFLNFMGGQLVQLDVPQGRDDVLIDPPLIGHLRVGSETCFLIGLIPVIQPVT